MTTTQKIIKYGALAFAMALIINIILAILFGINQLSHILGITNNTKLKNMETISTIRGEVLALEIELNTVGLEIKTGSRFAIASNSNRIKVQEQGSQIIIKETSHNWMQRNREVVEVTIPKNNKFREVKIETGAGQIAMDRLVTEQLDLDIGAGKVEIKDLLAAREADINGGAGKIDILKSTINNLDLDMGIGKCTLNTVLTGNNQIDAGVGELIINLLDTKDHYQIGVEKGIGSITLNQEQLIENKIYGTGLTNLKIDGGIGSIKITSVN